MEERTIITLTREIKLKPQPQVYPGTIELTPYWQEIQRLQDKAHKEIIELGTDYIANSLTIMQENGQTFIFYKYYSDEVTGMN